MCCRGYLSAATPGYLDLYDGNDGIETVAFLAAQDGTTFTAIGDPVEKSSLAAQPTADFLARDRPTGKDGTITTETHPPEYPRELERLCAAASAESLKSAKARVLFITSHASGKVTLSSPAGDLPRIVTSGGRNPSRKSRSPEASPLFFCKFRSRGHSVAILVPVCPDNTAEKQHPMTRAFAICAILGLTSACGGERLISEARTSSMAEGRRGAFRRRSSPISATPHGYTARDLSLLDDL